MSKSQAYSFDEEMSAIEFLKRQHNQLKQFRDQQVELDI